MRLHIIVYAVFVVSLLFDLATSIVCSQIAGLVETNLIYQRVGFWAFPIVYLIHTGFILTIEWFRKYSKHAPFILFINIFASLNAGAINLQLIMFQSLF